MDGARTAHLPYHDQRVVLCNTVTGIEYARPLPARFKLTGPLLSTTPDPLPPKLLEWYRFHSATRAFFLFVGNSSRGIELPMLRLDESSSRGLSVAFVELDVAAAASIPSTAQPSSAGGSGFDLWTPWSWPSFRLAKDPSLVDSKEPSSPTTPYPTTAADASASLNDPLWSKSEEQSSADDRKEKKPRTLFLLDADRLSILVRLVDVAGRYRTCTGTHSCVCPFVMY